MLIQYPPCTNCGNHWHPAEDVNALHTFCPDCSSVRQNAADQQFHTQERVLVHKGSYVFLSPHPNKAGTGRKHREWRLTAAMKEAK